MPEALLTPPEPMAAQTKAASSPLLDAPATEAREPLKKETKLTAEEAQKNIDAILSGLQTNAVQDKKKEKDEPKPEVKPGPEAKSEEKVETIESEKPKKKALKPKPQEVPLDFRQLTEVATAAATKAATEAVAGRTGDVATAALDKAPEIPEALKVYAEMAKINPQKYSTLVEEAKVSLEEIEIYKKDWRKNNPGQKFDPKADEHEEFFQKVEPQYEDDDYDDARVELRLAEKLAERDTIQQTKLDKIESKLTLSELEPSANMSALESINVFIASVFKNEIEGKPVTPDLVKKLAEDNPENEKLMQSAASIIVPFNKEVIRLFDSGGLYEYNAENEAHQYISNYASDVEQRYSVMTADETMRNGRKFSLRSDYDKMPPEQKQKHWRFHRDELLDIHTKEIIEKAKKIVDKEEEKYQAWEKRRNSRNGHAMTSSHDIKKETLDIAKPVVVKTDSPDGGGRSTVPINEMAGSGQPLNSRELLLKALQS